MNYRHILVIEDDVGIQAITKFSLEMEQNWVVTTAIHGKDGMLKAKTLNPDVILLDIIMPDTNGLDVLQELQNNQATRKIPVILFTAKVMANEIFELKNSRVKDIIIKPFDCLTLARRISDILGWQY